VELRGVFDPEGDAADIEGTAAVTVLNKDGMLSCEFFPPPKCNDLSEGTE
jgi:hypothetical protein